MWMANWANYDLLRDESLRQVRDAIALNASLTVSAADFHDVHPCELKAMSGGLQRSMQPSNPMSVPLVLERPRPLRVGASLSRRWSV